MMYFLLSILLLFAAQPAQAQQYAEHADGGIMVPADPRDGRPVFYESTVTVKLNRAKLTAKQQKQMEQTQKKLTKLRRDVRTVYELAKLSGKMLRETNMKLSTITDEKEKKKYTKELEDQLRDKYEGRIRQLTLSQGKVLIKLIHRETQNSAYQLLKDYRNGATAVFWQTVSKFFGADLKDGFHPTTDVEDAQIEFIVREIESGEDAHYY